MNLFDSISLFCIFKRLISHPEGEAAVGDEERGGGGGVTGHRESLVFDRQKMIDEISGGRGEEEDDEIRCITLRLAAINKRGLPVEGADRGEEGGVTFIW